MGMLGEKFPEAEFVVSGLLGPKYVQSVFIAFLTCSSNAHGYSLDHYRSVISILIFRPNEFLHIQMGKNLTCAVAAVIADHCKHHSSK